TEAPMQPTLGAKTEDQIDSEAEKEPARDQNSPARIRNAFSGLRDKDQQKRPQPVRQQHAAQGGQHGARLPLAANALLHPDRGQRERVRKQRQYSAEKNNGENPPVGGSHAQTRRVMNQKNERGVEQDEPGTGRPEEPSQRPSLAGENVPGLKRGDQQQFERAAQPVLAQAPDRAQGDETFQQNMQRVRQEYGPCKRLVTHSSVERAEIERGPEQDRDDNGHAQQGVGCSPETGQPVKRICIEQRGADQTANAQARGRLLRRAQGFIFVLPAARKEHDGQRQAAQPEHREQR